MSQPTAIIASDLHLRSTRPICRKDDYWLAQLTKIAYLRKLMDKYKCPLFLAGDIFDRGISSPSTEKLLIQQFSNKEIYCIPGQHDLINHKRLSWKEGSLGVLEASFIVNVLSNETLVLSNYNIRLHGVPYGEEIENNLPAKGYYNVLMLHTLTVNKGPLWFGDEKSISAKSLLRKYPAYDLIIVGDNHQPFVVEYKRRILVSPGSMMRMSIDQVNHKPRAYLWYAEDNVVEEAYYPIEEDVFLSETTSIKRKEDREQLEAFITNLNEQYDFSMNFTENIEKWIQGNKVSNQVEEEIWKALEV